VKFPRQWLKMLVLFALAAAIGFAAPSTLAYLAAQSNSLINSFDAPYFPPDAAGVPVHVIKTVRCTSTGAIGPEGFHFELTNVSTGDVYTLTTNADGHATLTLPFTDADVGQTYAYTLREVNDGVPFITYDDTVYTMSIAVSVNADNQVVAAATLNGEGVAAITATFENVYASGMDIPATGDSAPLALYALLALLGTAGAVIFSRSKQHL